MLVMNFKRDLEVIRTLFYHFLNICRDVQVLSVHARNPNIRNKLAKGDHICLRGANTVSAPTFRRQRVRDAEGRRVLRVAQRPRDRSLANPSVMTTK